MRAENTKDTSEKIFILASKGLFAFQAIVVSVVA